MSEPTVIVQRRGRLGHLTLNRPAAINALTAEMVTVIARTLDAWVADDGVHAVLLTGAGTRGLCAGGDIRAIHADAVAGGSESVRFWAAEYRLNAALSTYPKPLVAWMDGLVMGGGIGLSAHAGIRVVTERSRLAMPEVGIGFHPDVGGSWLLSRAPGELGTHLALTGSAIGAGDGIAAGLADHYLPSDRLPEVISALAEGGALTWAEPPPAELDRSWIDSCYTGDDVGTILERLTAHPSPAAQAAAKEIGTKSPTSLVVTLRSLRTAAHLPDLRAALDRELRLSAALLRMPDLVEGVRAQIIDKDRRPRWQPADLASVSPQLVDAMFAQEQPLGDGHS
ncbi:3-hydroxyisobutyryl-CoA hydrolase [Actinoplanes sp. OR16]|uniref:enoyl-CoA hydratase/isomerase family protein n=1 Tax=Actinoplanes sp. OR16 TaxID=946334 RepID=UPI000F70E0ED|nr:enoyl-CoA hydratase/isomerase family protein [Actinoplanes sp. OR16]BBH69147.1 3-hydroxyisobutyryl-CoA hydrolase [Actinoplanes sp. OR16]